MKFSSIAVLATLAFAKGDKGKPGKPPKGGKDKVYVNSLNYGGSGCDSGSVNAYVSGDQLSLTVEYTGLNVDASNSGKGKDRSAQVDCHVEIELTYRGGRRFVITDAQFAGHAELAQKSSATQASTFYLRNSPSPYTLQANLYGYYSGDYYLSQTVDDNSLVWSPCNESGQITIDTSATVYGKKGGKKDQQNTNALTPLSDGRVRQTYALQWAEC